MIKVWSMMITHPAQSLFIGCFPMGAATLINAGLVSVPSDEAHKPTSKLYLRTFTKTGRAAALPAPASFGHCGASGGSTLPLPMSSPSG